MRRGPRSRRRSPISTTTSWKRAKSRTKPRKRKRKSTEPRRGRAVLAYLGLGSNRGDRRAHLEGALDRLSRIAPVVAVSSFYRTDPVGYRAQRPFWNVVAAIRWRGSARALLLAAQAVERAVGRTPSFRNGPREIDIDLLDVGGRRRLGKRSADPILPHPRMQRRRFVLAPLAELDPKWRHPVSGRTAGELLRDLPERPRATRISSRPRGWPARRPGS